MDNKIEFSNFPKDVEEAIALLYVQSQDLSAKSPAEIYTLFQEAYFEIRKDKYEKQRSGWFTAKQEALRRG